MGLNYHNIWEKVFVFAYLKSFIYSLTYNIVIECKLLRHFMCNELSGVINDVDNQIIEEIRYYLSRPPCTGSCLYLVVKPIAAGGRMATNQTFIMCIDIEFMNGP